MKPTLIQRFCKQIWETNRLHTKSLIRKKIIRIIIYMLSLKKELTNLLVMALQWPMIFFSIFRKTKSYHSRKFSNIGKKMVLELQRQVNVHLISRSFWSALLTLLMRMSLNLNRQMKLTTKKFGNWKRHFNKNNEPSLLKLL